MNKSHISIHEEHPTDPSATGLPFITIKFKPAKTVEAISGTCHELISRLKQESNLILSIDSNLFALPPTERLPVASDLVKSLTESFQVTSTSRQLKVPKNFLENIFEGGSNERAALQSLLYIPHPIWMDEDLAKKLPIFGAHFYILKEGVDGIEIMDELWKGTMTGEAKTAAFEWDIFCCGMLGQMGVYAYGKDKNEVTKRLGE